MGNYYCLIFSPESVASQLCVDSVVGTGAMEFSGCLLEQWEKYRKF